MVTLIGIVSLSDAKQPFGGSSENDSVPLVAPFMASETINISDLASDAAGKGWSYTGSNSTLTFGIGSNNLGYEIIQSAAGPRSLNIVIQDNVDTELMISGLSIIGNVTLQGDASLGIYLNGPNSIKGSILVPSGTSLTVSGNSSNDSLVVTATDDRSAAIGGAGGQDGGDITINSGSVTAVGGKYAAAIGGGANGEGASIGISGRAAVTAYSGGTLPAVHAMNGNNSNGFLVNNILGETWSGSRTIEVYSDGDPYRTLTLPAGFAGYAYTTGNSPAKSINEYLYDGETRIGMIVPVSDTALMIEAVNTLAVTDATIIADVQTHTVSMFALGDFIDINPMAAALANQYTIAASGANFNAYNSVGFSGTYTSFTNALNAIRTNANRAESLITFSGSPLNIGTESMSFDTTLWGIVTLAGSVTSSVSTADGAVVALSGTMSLTSQANITNTYSGTTVSVIRNNGTGPLTVSAGTLTSPGGYTIRNNATGSVTVNGSATVINTGSTGSDQSDNAILNNSSGSIFIGGSATLKANSNVIRTQNNSSTGTMLTISGGTITGGMYGIDHFASGGIVISGGTITGTATNIIYNAYAASITISGGTLIKTSGTGIQNSSGTVNMTGGTINIQGSSSGYAITGGFVNISGSANITSSGSGATINVSGSGTAARLTMTGGTIANTHTSGYAIQQTSTSPVNISGGTVKAASSNHTIYSTSTGPITISGAADVQNTGTGRAIHLNTTTSPLIISGAPKITGSIYAAPGMLTASGLTNSTNVYEVFISGTLSNGLVAVIGGATYNTRFTTVNPNYRMLVSGSNLTISLELRTISFNLNGVSVSGSATPSSITVDHGTSPSSGSKPAGTWTWTNYAHNNTWYTRSASSPYVYTPFIFGTTTVTANVALFLVWTPTSGEGIPYTMAASGSNYNVTKSVFGSSSTYNGTVAITSAPTNFQ
ncbi:MAG: hypothetical protein LBE48_05235, partial [Methanomassiliicoccaceae archaeon]|nr:hypothetical protein [Methanomassiliicoccaceae archaeon]